jgi:uncharacterized protein YdaU (DUF1376 family)
MVAWYKHDIPAWMDGTEALDAEPYRTYHVICQLIYMNEGPIALNEHGIAGRCKQSIRTFRAALKTLLDMDKLTLSDGRLANSRAEKELENVSENRVNASKGGHKSAEVRNSANKPLKINNESQAPLQEDRSLKTRLEETREEKKETRVPALVFESDWPKEYREEFWREYPKRTDKQAALKKLEQVRRAGSVPWTALIGGVRRYAGKVRGKDQTYTKGPAAWLSAGKWDDEDAPVYSADEACPPEIYRNVL